MLNLLKSFAILAVVLGMVAGCSSNKAVSQDTVVEPEVRPVVEAPVTVSTDPLDAIAHVATVFYFEFDSAVLRPEARAALIAHAEFLRSANKTVRLEGHTDERGTREYNLALGERRANAVRDFLVLQGVPRAKIETVSYGKERPAQVGSSESSWSKNRRVELKYR